MSNVYEIKYNDGRKFRVFCLNRHQEDRLYKALGDHKDFEVITNGIHTIKQFENIIKLDEVLPNARYRDIEDAQKGIRENGTDDYISIKGVVYTMMEYDNDGIYIQYYNKRTDSMIEVTTSNRYGDTKFTDAVVEINDKWGIYRNDINYID